MTLTVRLDDSTAAQLSRKASACQVPVEQFAAQLLGAVVQQLDEAEQRRSTNQRRVSLIRQSATQTLSSDELAELQALQTALDNQLEPVDEQLLGHLTQMHLQFDQLGRTGANSGT